jgi:hypothetical protein
MVSTYIYLSNIQQSPDVVLLKIIQIKIQVKVKVHPITGLKGRRGGVEI